MTDKKVPYVRDISDAEDARIRAAITQDPDTVEADPDTPPLRRGRPKGRSKMQVTVSLDIDLVETLKSPDAKGWQTRLNTAARRGLDLG